MILYCCGRVIETPMEDRHEEKFAKFVHRCGRCCADDGGTARDGHARECQRVLQRLEEHLPRTMPELRQRLQRESKHLRKHGLLYRRREVRRGHPLQTRRQQEQCRGRSTRRRTRTQPRTLNDLHVHCLCLHVSHMPPARNRRHITF